MFMHICVLVYTDHSVVLVPAVIMLDSGVSYSVVANEV